MPSRSRILDPVVTEIIGMGRVGSQNAASAAAKTQYLKGAPSPEEERERKGRAVQRTFIYAIDAVMEEKVKWALRQGILEPSEAIRVTPPTTFYTHEGLEGISEHYWVLSRYMPIVTSQIRLVKGGGTSRYRPLARAMLYAEKNGVRPVAERILRSLIREDHYGFHDQNTPNTINTLVLTASLGGGFGSGILLDMLKLVEIALKIENINPQTLSLVLTLPTGFRIQPPPADRVLGSEEESKASAGAALTEILWLIWLTQEGRPYTDTLLETIVREIGREDIDPRIRVNIPILMFLASYRDITGGSIREIYEKQDAATTALLVALATTIPRDVLRDAQYINERVNTGPQALLDAARRLGLEDCIQENTRALATFTPVASYNAFIITPSYEGVITPELANHAKAEEDYIKKIENIKKEIEEIRKRITKNNEDLTKLENIKSTISRKTENVQKLENSLREIGDLVKSLNGSLTAAAANVNSKEFCRSVEESLVGLLSNLKQKIDGIKGYIEQQISEYSKLSINVDEKARSLASLQENVGSIEKALETLNDEGLLKLMQLVYNKRLLAGIVNNELLTILRPPSQQVRGLIKDIRCSLWSVIRQKCWCRAKSRLEEEAANLEGRIEGLDSELGRLSSVYENAERIYSAFMELHGRLVKHIIEENERLEKRVKKLEEERKKYERMLEDTRRALREAVKESYNRLMQNMPWLSPAIAESIIMDIVEGLRSEKIRIGEGGVVFGKEYDYLKTISGIMDKYRGVGQGIGELTANIIESVQRFADSAGPLVGFDAADLLDTVEDIYLLYSEADATFIEQQLVPAIRNTIEGRRINLFTSVVPGLRETYIAVVKVVYNIPLVAVREFREIMKKYSERVERTVYRVKQVPGPSGVRYRREGGVIAEREMRGRMYHVINYDKEFEKFVEDIVRVVKCFEERYNVG